MVTVTVAPISPFGPPPYQASIPLIPCKLHSNYSVINLEIGSSSTTIKNH
jgi:hypothetical protein